MKFLVDAHLPRALCVLLRTAGHEALHTSQLPASNRTADTAISERSLEEQRVVITKDTDFYHSHLLQGKPWKLLLVRTGNIRTRELTALFERNLPAIIIALDKNSLVELDRQAIRVVT